MGYPVTYYCPRCGTLVEIERDGYLADKAVTPYPLEGWTYAAPTEPFEDADGVRFVCGESDGVVWDPHDGVRGTDVDGDVTKRGDEAKPGDATKPDDATKPGDATVCDDADDPDTAGCGESFYLSFVRYDEGREVDPRSEPEFVEIDPGSRPRGPRGPTGPGGPTGSGGGFR